MHIAHPSCDGIVELFELRVGAELAGAKHASNRVDGLKHGNISEGKVLGES